MTTATLLALAAALAFAVGNNLQRDAAAQVPAAGYGAVRLLLRLLRSPRWLAGGAAAVVGLVCQTVALGSGGVILVQAVIASTLVFALAIEAAVERRRPRAGQLAGAALVVAGIVLLVSVGRPGTGTVPASPWRAAPAWVAVAVVGGGALVLAARRPRGRLTALALGGAAGVCFALDAVFLRALAVAASPWQPVAAAAAAVGFAVASVVGNLAVQRGFQLAPLRSVLPALAAAEPLSAFAAGILLFGEHLDTGLPGLAGVVGGLGCMIVGVAVSALADPHRTSPRVAAEETVAAA